MEDKPMTQPDIKALEDVDDIEMLIFKAKINQAKSTYNAEIRIAKAKYTDNITTACMHGVSNIMQDNFAAMTAIVFAKELPKEKVQNDCTIFY